ncbi:MAG: SDR family NAD(P)-dependent oxidoreductase, partial [Candidatus Promineifilaceae bacterium]
MTNYSNKVVAVTGAAGNLGRATSMAFLNQGARLAVIDRRRDDLNNVFSETVQECNQCLYVSGDLTDSQSVDEMVGSIMDFFGRLDVLVNIAGGFTMGPPVHET